MLTSLLHHETDPVADASRILTEAVEAYRPSHVFGLYSGGNDSVCAVHIAKAILGDRLTAAVHINTQTGIAETREHVGAVAQTQGWRLMEYTPPAPAWAKPGETAYEAILRRWGFPGPAGHRVIYNRLKERCVRQLVREHKRHARDRIMLVGGMRLAESTRRMGNAEECGAEGARVWVAPILRWENWDKDAYMQANHLPRNPVTDKLGISGECNCGCFACPGERERIERHYPTQAQRIAAWEEVAREAGKPCVWGERPPEEEKKNPDQTSLFGLCWSCGTKSQKRSA